MRGFKNFLMRGDVIVVAVGLVIALAFSVLITAFTTSIINPIVAAAGGKSGLGLGFLSATNPRTFVNIGAFISAVIYFVDLHGRHLLPHHRAVQGRPGPARAGRIRRPGAGQDVPGVPVHRPAGRRVQVQVLRHRPARHRLRRDGTGQAGGAGHRVGERDRPGRGAAPGPGRVRRRDQLQPVRGRGPPAKTPGRAGEPGRAPPRAARRRERRRGRGARWSSRGRARRSAGWTRW